ncbi:uncharacterized protein LOC131597573 [Vicia villosa]|uniref:uncharacterized protein LOC131597573 n=1 Tax=Vicia villosa TaxID=3911 RepID=UPI00273B5A3F|nr:uncharacterized protein LOC131597573 [Vicia villosa]
MLLGLNTDGKSVFGNVQQPNALCVELLGVDFLEGEGRQRGRGQGIKLFGLQLAYQGLELNRDSSEESKLQKNRMFNATGMDYTNTPVNKIIFYRQLLDRLRPQDFLWRPYLGLDHVPDRKEAAVWTAKFLKDLCTNKRKVKGRSLITHEIIGSLGNGDGGEVAELQWKRIVDDLLQKGKMTNCIAVCDVSGSMDGIPMVVSVALGLLVFELSEEPWKGKVITFSSDPQLHLIEGDSLKSKTEFVRNMDMGYNTDFPKVFDCILDVAVNGKLKEEQMIKRIFVFSDMEFDEASKHYDMESENSDMEFNQASENSWETDYQAITRKYKEKVYGSAVPQTVFWNLRNSKATPVPSTQKGVALVSGFSKNLLTLFLDNEGDISPLEMVG